MGKSKIARHVKGKGICVHRIGKGGELKPLEKIIDLHKYEFVGPGIEIG